MRHFSYHTTATASGFTLVETLVAISVLLIVIVGPMTVATNSARSTSFSSEQVQAFFLAQEGLELAQKARDDLLLDSADYTAGWSAFTDDSSSGELADCHTGSCGLQLDSADEVTVINCPSGSANACRVYFDPNGGRNRFSHDDSSVDAEPTPFIREITFNHTGDEVEVISTVRWRTGPQAAEQTVVLDTYLFNIYGN